jgi:outer membrane protein assembly factor BamB
MFNDSSDTPLESDPAPKAEAETSVGKPDVALPSEVNLPSERGLARADLVFAGLLMVFLGIAVLIQVIRGDRIAGLDNAVRNLVAGAAIMLCGFLGALWFCFFSRFSGRIRAYLGIGGIISLVCLMAVLKVEEVSGDMVPKFRWVWERADDYQLKSERGTGDPISLAAGPLDFPGYFGRYGNGVVDTVKLDTDWSKLKPAWRQSIGAGWSGFAAVNGYAVTMEQRGELEQVTCYDIHTGKLAWQHSLELRHETTLGGVGPKATPTISNGRVYALGGTGVVRCLDGRNGDLFWKIDIPDRVKISDEEEAFQIRWGRSNSVLVVDDLIVVPAGGHVDGTKHSLIAFDAESGKERWRGGDRNPSYSSPIVATLNGVRQIVSVNEDNITGHTIEDGTVLWEVEWLGQSNAAASTSQPHIVDGGLLITKGYGAGVALFDVTHSNGKWDTDQRYHKARYLKTKLTSVVVHDEYAYGLSDGIMQCVRVEDGKLMWKNGRYGHGQLLRVGDKLVVVSDKGVIALLAASPEGLEEFGRVQAIKGKTWNTLCLYGRFLLVRNSNEAACFELPVATK